MCALIFSVLLKKNGVSLSFKVASYILFFTDNVKEDPATCRADFGTVDYLNDW